MNIESILPLLIIPALLFVSFLLEGMVIYFLHLKKFWASIGIAILINLLSLVVLYFSCVLLNKIGYEFNGMQIPVQVFLFLWWISVIADGLLLQAFSRNKLKEKIYLTSIVMNTVSYLFLYFFVSNSH